MTLELNELRWKEFICIKWVRSNRIIRRYSLVSYKTCFYDLSSNSFSGHRGKISVLQVSLHADAHSLTWSLNSYCPWRMGTHMVQTSYTQILLPILYQFSTYTLNISYILHNLMFDSLILNSIQIKQDAIKN